MTVGRHDCWQAWRWGLMVQGITMPFPPDRRIAQGRPAGRLSFRLVARAASRSSLVPMILVLVVLSVLSPAAGGRSGAAEPVAASGPMPDAGSALPRAITHDPFPSYQELCGFPIVIAPTPFVALATADKDGALIIIIDPDLMRPEEHFHRLFMIAHECAHHVMGHTTAAARAQRRRSGRVVRDQELSADCWAAETLARAGLGRFVAIMATRFHRAGLYSPGAGYPAGLHRSLIVRHCAAAGYHGQVGSEESPPIPLTSVP